MPKTLEDLRTCLARDALHGANHCAYSWVMERLQPGWKVLDLGSRYSRLPSLMATFGCQVVATDRDDAVLVHQAAIAREWGVEFDVMQWQPCDGSSVYFDAVTACWAIQHNEPVVQCAIACQLAKLLVAGGRLLIVSSFTAGETFHQTNRLDPQWVLSGRDHERLIVQPSGLQLRGLAHFQYEHGTHHGDFCAPATANAICYELTKD